MDKHGTDNSVQDVADMLLKNQQDKENPDEDQVEDHEDDNLEDDQSDSQPEAEDEESEEEELEDENYSDDEEEEELEESTVLETEDLEGFHTNVTVNGQDEEVTLNELRNGYMKDVDYRQKTMDLQKDKEGVETEFNQLQETRKKFVEHIDNLGQMMVKPFSDDQLARIKADQGWEDYSEAKEQNEAHDKKIAVLQQARDETINQGKADFKVKLDALKVSEKAAIVAAIPELAKKENEEKLHKFLSSMNFTEEQIESTVDHRLFIMAEKARKYDELQKKGKKKINKKTPKLLRKKATTSKGTISSRKLGEARSKANASGSSRDVANFLLEKRKQKR